MSDAIGPPVESAVGGNVKSSGIALPLSFQKVVPAGTPAKKRSLPLSLP